MPDQLPVGLQDFLRRREPGVRKEELMIHQYKRNGYDIVVDVYSGSVHLVDDVAYDIIRLFCEKSRDEIVTAMMEKYGGSLVDGAPVTEADIAETYEDVLALKEAINSL